MTNWCGVRYASIYVSSTWQSYMKYVRGNTMMTSSNGNIFCVTGHFSLHWRHYDYDSVSNHQPHGCLLNRLLRPRSKKTSKLPVTGPLCGEFTGTGEFPAQRASYAENVSIWWRHHGAGNSPVAGEFPAQRPVARSFDVFFDDVIKWKHFPRNWPFVRGIHHVGPMNLAIWDPFIFRVD